MNYYVDVILPLPLKGTFTYELSQDEFNKLEIGFRVAVSFGKRKVLVNYEYIEKLEKKKRTFKSPTNTKGFNLLEKLYFKHQRKFIFFD